MILTIFTTQTFDYKIFKHITYFHSSRKFLVLENQRGILHAFLILGSKEKITANSIFNFISAIKIMLVEKCSQNVPFLLEFSFKKSKNPV